MTTSGSETIARTNGNSSDPSAYMKLSLGIKVCFTLALIFLLSDVVVLWMAISTTSRDFNSSVEIEKSLSLIDSSRLAMVDMRARAREFILTGNHKILENWAERKAAAADPLADFVVNAAEPDQRDAAKYVQQSMRSWLGDVDTVVILRGKRDVLIGDILTAAEAKADTDIQDIVHALGSANDNQTASLAGLVLGDILRVRTDRLDYEENDDSQNFDAYEEAIDQFEADSAQLAPQLKDDRLKKEFEDAVDNLARDKSAFEALARAVKEYEHVLVDQMTPKGDQIDSAYLQIVAREYQNQTNFRDATQARMKRIKVLILVISVAAICLWLIFAHLALNGMRLARQQD